MSRPLSRQLPVLPRDSCLLTPASLLRLATTVTILFVGFDIVIRLTPGLGSSVLLAHPPLLTRYRS